MKKRVFLTGANGFIGQYVLKELLSQGVTVLAHSRTPVRVAQDYQVCHFDLNDLKSVEAVLAEFHPDSIVHLAAIASPTYGNIAELYKTNVEISENLLEAASRIRNNCRVVLASTAGVYGNSEFDKISENCAYNPQNHYSYSKMVMEFIAKNYMDSLDIKIVRSFNVIGKSQKENFLIPKLVKAFAEKQKVLKVGNLNTVRDYVNIEFSAKVFAKLALDEYCDLTYLNICSGNGVKGTEIISLLKDIYNYLPEIEVCDEFLRKNEIMSMIGNPALCFEYMGEHIRPLPIEQILKSFV